MKKQSNRYNHNYNLIKKYSIKKIFKLINNEEELPDKILYNNSDYSDSFRRAKIIKNLIERDGCYCNSCKEVPTFFSLGKDINGYFHLDLYSLKDNTPYMYTIDHIHPKSKGGLNNMNNYQLLCKICNEDKSDNIPGENGIIEIQDMKKCNYIPNKLKSLNKQTSTVLSKLNKVKIIPIKNCDGFTSGNQYKINNIKVEIDDAFDSKYVFYLKNDNEEIVPINIEDFITKKDFRIFNK